MVVCCILVSSMLLIDLAQTHNVALASTVAQFTVSLGRGGKIAAQGSIADALKNSKIFADELETSRKLVEEANEDVDTPAAQPQQVDGKLMVAEEVEEGRVSWNACKCFPCVRVEVAPSDRPAVAMFLKALGGQLPILFISSYILLFSVNEMILAGQAWFLGYWASEYTEYPPSEVPVAR